MFIVNTAFYLPAPHGDIPLGLPFLLPVSLGPESCLDLHYPIEGLSLLSLCRHRIDHLKKVNKAVSSNSIQLCHVTGSAAW